MARLIWRRRARSRGRGRALIAPQILAQHAARNAPLRFEALLAAAAAAPNAAATCGASDAAAADMDAA
jgi:hypothetical protein